MEGLSAKVNMGGLQTLGKGMDSPQGPPERKGGLACCDSWGCKESDTTEQLN